MFERSVIYNRRKDFMENAYKVFSQNKIEKEARAEMKQLQEREEELMAKVGKLTIENDRLKKIWRNPLCRFFCNCNANVINKSETWG